MESLFHSWRVTLLHSFFIPRHCLFIYHFNIGDEQYKKNNLAEKTQKKNRKHFVHLWDKLAHQENEQGAQRAIVRALDKNY